MARYFTRAAGWIEDETYSDDGAMPAELYVPEHEPIDTGLVDALGDPIMRAPNPMGFGRDGEW